jgi:hypothetical protein
VSAPGFYKRGETSRGTISGITIALSAENGDFVCLMTKFQVAHCHRYGCAVAQTISRRPLTAEVRVRTRVNSCGICGAQSSTGRGYSPSSSVLPCQYHSLMALNFHIICGMNNWSFGGHSSKIVSPRRQEQITPLQK